MRYHKKLELHHSSKIENPKNPLESAKVDSTDQVGRAQLIWTLFVACAVLFVAVHQYLGGSQPISTLWQDPPVLTGPRMTNMR